MYPRIKWLFKEYKLSAIEYFTIMIVSGVVSNYILNWIGLCK